MSSISTKCFILFFSFQNTNRAYIKLMTCFCYLNGLDGLEISNEFNLYKGLFDLKKTPPPIAMDLELLLQPHSAPLTIRHSRVLFDCSLFFFVSTFFVKILNIKTTKIDKLNFRNKQIYGRSIIKLLTFQVQTVHSSITKTYRLVELSTVLLLSKQRLIFYSAAKGYKSINTILHCYVSPGPRLIFCSSQNSGFIHFKKILLQKRQIYDHSNI